MTAEEEAVTRFRDLEAALVDARARSTCVLFEEVVAADGVTHAWRRSSVEFSYVATRGVFVPRLLICRYHTSVDPTVDARVVERMNRVLPWDETAPTLLVRLLPHLSAFDDEVVRASRVRLGEVLR